LLVVLGPVGCHVEPGELEQIARHLVETTFAGSLVERPPVTLGELGPDAAEALPALQAALEDEDEAVRTEAARAIERIQTAP
jgi:HEAT repeat protein